MAARIVPNELNPVVGSDYPPPFDAPCLARVRLRLGDAAGLTQFGVNQLRLKPGAWSSQRHWHSHEDEFVFVLSGEVTLITEAGEQILRAGECAGFKAGERDGHCLRNHSEADAVVLEMGRRDAADITTYPDIDMIAPAGGKPASFTHRDGTPYPE